MKTWHQTIEYIRTQPEYKNLVEQAYFDADLELNVKRFVASPEFKETLNLLSNYIKNDKLHLLDIGAGNGISSVGFALQGYDVVAVEPDPSDSIGAGAIRILKDKLKLSNLHVEQNYAEEIGLKDESFDVVYVRQAVHHAHDLQAFIKQAARVLKKDGVFISVRDHVIFDQKDKDFFLEAHDLHKFYGGENAFTKEEYKNAFKNAGLTLVKELGYFDSIINYFPLTSAEIASIPEKEEKIMREALRAKLGKLASFPLVFSLYKMKNGIFGEKDYYNERKVPGRLYSFVCIKKS